MQLYGGLGDLHRGTLPEGSSGLCRRHEQARCGAPFQHFARHCRQGHGIFDPPGYRRTAPVKRPKLDGFTEIIDSWLDGDKANKRLLLPDDAPRLGYSGPNPALQVNTTRDDFSLAGMIARNVTKY